MRLLLVETEITGHHLSYLRGLCEALDSKDELCIVLPQKTEEIPEFANTKIIPFDYHGKRHYFLWLIRLSIFIREFRPDMVHFVYGDDFYRYFGLGIRLATRKTRVLITIHQVRRSKLRDWSVRRIASLASKLIVHTAQLEKDLKNDGINNVIHIEYPQFSLYHDMDKKQALSKLGIEVSERCPVLLALGGTREDKGLDILLDALKRVKTSFYLIIAGKEEFFSSEFIADQIIPFSEQVSVILEYLSDEKMEWCLNASDVIVLPYRKSFDGASGPLCQGVWLRKEIIGPSHGSLREIIENNHLGKTFQSENAESLSRVLEEELEKEWECDDKYNDYRMQITPTFFVEHHYQLYHGETL